MRWYLNSHANSLPSRILDMSFRSLVICPSIGFIGTPTRMVHSVANLSTPSLRRAGTKSSYEGCLANACLTSSSARLYTAVLSSFDNVGIVGSTDQFAPGGAVNRNALDKHINMVVLTAPIRSYHEILLIEMCGKIHVVPVFVQYISLPHPLH